MDDSSVVQLQQGALRLALRARSRRCDRGPVARWVAGVALVRAARPDECAHVGLLCVGAVFQPHRAAPVRVGSDAATRWRATASDEPHNLHGTAWLDAWQVLQRSPSAVTLENTHPATSPGHSDSTSSRHSKLTTRFAAHLAGRHQHRRAADADGAGLASVFRAPRAQPRPPGVAAPLGCRRNPSCRCGAWRRTCSTPTSRCSTSTTASTAGAARRAFATSACRCA